MRLEIYYVQQESTYLDIPLDTLTNREQHGRRRPTQERTIHNMITESLLHYQIVNDLQLFSSIQQHLQRFCQLRDSECRMTRLCGYV